MAAEPQSCSPGEGRLIAFSAHFTLYAYMRDGDISMVRQFVLACVLWLNDRTYSK